MNPASLSPAPTNVPATGSAADRDPDPHAASASRPGTPRVPAGFESLRRTLPQILQPINGWLSDREARFLLLLAACPTAPGDLLELGSYEGKSTIALASGARLSQQGRLYSIDRLPPDRLNANLRRAGLVEQVEVMHGDSTGFVEQWDRPLRLVWHDGANDHHTVVDEIDRLVDWMNDGAIVAMHDVLNRSGERIRCFVDRVLGSEDFGAAGVVGSIGWAQRCHQPERRARSARQRQSLIDRLLPLVRYHDFGKSRNFASRIAYKLKRRRVPHGEPAPGRWLARVA